VLQHTVLLPQSRTTFCSGIQPAAAEAAAAAGQQPLLNVPQVQVYVLCTSRRHVFCLHTQYTAAGLAAVLQAPVWCFRFYDAPDCSSFKSALQAMLNSMHSRALQQQKQRQLLQQQQQQEAAAAIDADGSAVPGVSWNSHVKVPAVVQCNPTLHTNAGHSTCLEAC
jgi:hypothetical protein